MSPRLIPRATSRSTPRGPFKNLATARTAMDVWRVEYNMVRPHQVLNREVRQAERF
ncbi:MAG: integrase core domain-containing protein [Pseudonocardiaceae bacterium]